MCNVPVCDVEAVVGDVDSFEFDCFGYQEVAFDAGQRKCGPKCEGAVEPVSFLVALGLRFVDGELSVVQLLHEMGFQFVIVENELFVTVIDDMQVVVVDLEEEGEYFGQVGTSLLRRRGVAKAPVYVHFLVVFFPVFATATCDGFFIVLVHRFGR